MTKWKFITGIVIVWILYKCPSQSSCGDLVSSWWCYWEVVEHLGGEAYWGSAPLGMCLWRGYGDTGPFLSLCLLATMRSSFALLHASRCDHAVKSPMALKLWVEISLSSFKLIFSGSLSQWESWSFDTINDFRHPLRVLNASPLNKRRLLYSSINNNGSYHLSVTI